MSSPAALLPGSAQHPAADPWLTGPQPSKGPDLGQVVDHYDLQAVPGAEGVPTLVVVPMRVRGKLLDADLCVVPLTGEWSDIVRNSDGKRYFMDLALGRGRSSAGPITRIFSLHVSDKYDHTSLYYTFAPWPRTEGVTVESRVMEQDSKVTHSRQLLVGMPQDARVFTVGDCNGDREEDCLLLSGQGGDSILLSGRDLSSLGEIPVGPQLGTACCALPDLDGDGVREVFAARGLTPEHLDESGARTHGPEWKFASQPYLVLSPGKRAVLAEGRLVRPSSRMRIVRSATWAGYAPAGGVQVAILTATDDGSCIFVIDVGTGELSETIEAPGGYPPAHGDLASGVLPGLEGRRWIAWSLRANETAPQRVFAAELGVAGSTQEIPLPADGRRYGDCLCAFPRGTEGRDGLAITVAAWKAEIPRAELSPVLFLDVARLFEKR